MYWQENKRIKLILSGIGLFITAIIIISVAIIISHSGKIKTTIKFQPADAQVFLDGSNKNINNSTIYLRPGEYQLSAFLDDYLYQTQSITVNEYNSHIVGQLIPINASDDEISNLLDQLNTDYMTAQVEATTRLTEIFPIISYLPYNPLNSPFGITYDFNDDYSKLTINVNLHQKDDSIALNYALIKLKNFNPDLTLTQYDININNFTNVFINKFQDNNKIDPIDYIKTGFRSIQGIQVKEGIAQNNYYYTIIQDAVIVPDTTNTDYIPYVVILKQDGDSWSLAGTPSPIVTIYNTPDTPTEILDLANSYTGE